MNHNIAGFLPHIAESRPYDTAIFYPNGMVSGKYTYSHYTYKQLEDESNIIAAGLERIGITKGVRTVLMVTPSLEFFALTFGLFKTGAVPVMIDPGIGLKPLKKCIAIAQPQAFIGIPKAHIARRLFRWGKNTLSIFVHVGPKLFSKGKTLTQVKALGRQTSTYQMGECQPEDVAAILFTSGSTGIPKGVMYEHQHFYNQVLMLKEMFDIQPGEINIPTFPLYALFDPALGMTSVIPDMDPTCPARVNPDNILHAVNDFGATNIFGSPALLNTVGRAFEKENITLPSLKRVISNGAPVPAHIMERFSKILNKQATIFAPYGSTEALPVTNISHHEIVNESWKKTEQGAGVCVGKPRSENNVKIIPISNEKIENIEDTTVCDTGEIGEITVTGPTVTKEYFHLKEQTQLAKIKDDTHIRHRMGDIGYLDRDGNLWMCGRKSQIVHGKDAVLYTVPVEQIFNAHPAIYRSALVGVKKSNDTIPVIILELEVHATNKQAILQELKELAKSYHQTSTIEHFLLHPSLPVDIRHNAKIQREKLTLWAQKRI